MRSSKYINIFGRKPEKLNEEFQNSSVKNEFNVAINEQSKIYAASENWVMIFRACNEVKRIRSKPEQFHESATHLIQFEAAALVVGLLPKILEFLGTHRNH